MTRRPLAGLRKGSCVIRLQASPLTPAGLQVSPSTLSWTADESFYSLHAGQPHLQAPREPSSRRDLEACTRGFGISSKSGSMPLNLLRGGEEPCLFVAALGPDSSSVKIAL